MKFLKSFLFLALTLISLNGYAQVPERVSKSLILEFTETWCGPCGSWGWDLARNVSAQLGNKGYILGVHNSSTPQTMNAKCSDAFRFYIMDTSMAFYNPTFFINNVDRNVTTVPSVMAYVDPFAATDPVASPAASFTINGNVLTINAKAKFWKDTSGTYLLAAFVVEDSVMATQAGHTGFVPHLHVLRQSAPDLIRPWGTQIASGNVAANTEYSDTRSVNIEPTWKKEKLDVYMAIYKVKGNKYEFVNAGKGKRIGGSTSIAEVSNVESVTLYPNPTTGASTLNIALREAISVKVKITDAVGRIVYTSGEQKLHAGDNKIPITVNDLSNGVYNVSMITADGKVISKPLVVTKP